MNSKLLLYAGFVLVAIGLLKPDISSIGLPIGNPKCNIENYVIDPPNSDTLLSQSKSIIEILQSSNDSTRPSDCMKLSSLFSDMATLISLDGEDKIISDTASIREANSLSGKMLRLNIKDKYPGLADASKTLITQHIGDDDLVLDENLRNKSVEAFRALSWAFYEGSK